MFCWPAMERSLGQIDGLKKTFYVITLFLIWN